MAEGRTSFDKLLFGEENTGADSLVKPYGIAARDGVVYVCDTKRSRVTRMDFKERTYTSIGMDGPGRLRQPVNLTMDALGYKFVVDAFRKQIVVFGPDDQYVIAFSLPEPSHPVDVAIWENELYVLDNDESPQIYVLDRQTREVLRSFGSEGSGPCQFKIPNSICIDSEGFLYVSDTINCRIHKLTREGQEIWVRGSPGRRLGQFGRPRGIRAGPDGIIYVVEGAMQLVQMFDGEGSILMTIGGPGNVPGAMVLPASIAVDATSIPYFQEYIHEDFDAQYLLFVANQYGSHKLNVYAFGSFPEGYQLGSVESATLPPVDPSNTFGGVPELDAEEGGQ